MAGGYFTQQNKERPGAYFNVRGVPIPPNPNDIGVAMMATHLSAAPVVATGTRPVVTLTRTAFYEGTSLSVAGVAYNQQDALSRKLAIMFENVANIILVATNTNATPATVDVPSAGTITAKLAGTFANSLTVTIAEDQFSRFTIVVLQDGLPIETIPNVTDIESVNSRYVEFSDGFVLANNAGINLTAGADGADSYDTIIEDMRKLALERQVVNTIHIDNIEQSAAKGPELKEAVNYLRERGGVLVVGYVANTVYNDDFYMNGPMVDTLVGWNDEDVDATFLLAELAALHAGSRMGQSNTYYVIKSGKALKNPIPQDEVENYLFLGHQVLSTRLNGDLVLEKDINDFRQFNNEYGYAFSKNRVIRTIDYIQHDSRLEWENNFIGKVDNNEIGVEMFKAWMIGYLTELEANGIIKNFVGNEDRDLQIQVGSQIDSVIGSLYVQPVDAMEKLYINLFVRQQNSTDL